MTEARATVAADGDRIDLICWRHYGSLGGGTVERVLDANPGVSMAAELSAGVEVFLPDIEPAKLERSLW
jgi:phage tail protein X